MRLTAIAEPFPSDMLEMQPKGFNDKITELVTSPLKSDVCSVLSLVAETDAYTTPF